jgi:hypothetical protein
MLLYDIFIVKYAVYVLGFSQSRIVTVDYVLLKIAPVTTEFYLL